LPYSNFFDRTIGIILLYVIYEPCGHIGTIIPYIVNVSRRMETLTLSSLRLSPSEGVVKLTSFSFDLTLNTLVPEWG
jgi:hypothetical protein